jgi:hypothetical protein
MNYQLVLQLPVSSIKDYDAMIELEDVSVISGRWTDMTPGRAR